ncbi:mitochondrial matrix Mmp37-domain-containing protein [Dipodascopsis uninucleata]
MYKIGCRAGTASWLLRRASRHLTGGIESSAGSSPPPPPPSHISPLVGAKKPKFRPKHVLPEAVRGDQYLLHDDLTHDRLLKEVTKFSQLPENFGFNQHIPIDDEMKERLRSTLWMFKAPIRYAFAYGSGVFSQGQKYKSGEKPQIDLIFGVTYAEHWHSLNMSQYPEHYSFLRRFGSGAVSFVQDKVGAGVYFNPYVEINGMVIKYGVVTIDTLCRDLINWDTLYLSGRLHKPVKILRDDPRVRLANQRNLFSVLRTALLLLPETFTEHDLYTTIASISYMGDPRMSVAAENPNKVQNIVNNQRHHFHRLYAPLIDTLPNIEIAGGVSELTDNVKLVQDMDPVRRGNMVSRLPSSFRQKIYSRYTSLLGVEADTKSEGLSDQSGGSSVDMILSRSGQGSELDRHIAAHQDLPKEIARALRFTVNGPALSQSIKGVFTAGFSKSLRYGSEKYHKWQDGRNESS